MPAAHVNLSDGTRVVDSDKIWAVLVTNTSYLTGLLTLEYSLRRVGSRYPLVALYTDSLPPEGHRALDARRIPKQRVDYLEPSPPPRRREGGGGGSEEEDNSNKNNINGTDAADNNDDDDVDVDVLAPVDPRFRDCWTKLAVFSMTQYARIALLDADMLVRRNMDELLDADALPLDPSDENNNSNNNDNNNGRLFAAGHACLCNPRRLPSYPADWTPAACPFTAMVERMRHDSNNHRENENDHDDNVESSNGISISSNSSSDKELNGGLLVVCPSQTLSAQIQSALQAFALAHSHSHPPPSPSPPASPSPLTESKENGKKKKKKKPHHHLLLLPFAEQSLLSRLFPRRWAPLPYAYNALKTLRWRGVHDGLWRDGEVRCVHYILTPKPWEREGRGEREKEKGGGGGGEGGEEREERERNGYGERSREESEEEGMGDNGVVPAVVVEDDEVTYGWWDEVDAERRRWEREAGIEADGW